MLTILRKGNTQFSIEILDDTPEWLMRMKATNDVYEKLWMIPDDILACWYRPLSPDEQAAVLAHYNSST